MQHSHHEESCHRTKQCGITGPFLVQKPMFFVRAQLPENRSIYQGFGHPMVLCLQEAGCDPLPLNFKGIPYWIQKHACWLCLFFFASRVSWNQRCFLRRQLVQSLSGKLQGRSTACMALHMRRAIFQYFLCHIFFFASTYPLEKYEWNFNVI